MKFTDFHNSELAEASKTRNPTRDFLRNNPVSPDEMAKPVKQMSVPELATVSDEALDNAYHYGRSTPGNTFGWQANLKSAAYAKQLIDKGVTDIEQISDAIHKGWNVTARAFVQNPDQFDDTEKLKAAGKLEAKLQQRAKLMNIEYAQLPDDEQEKDRVVARALLQAIKGQQGVAEDRVDSPVSSAITRRILNQRHDLLKFGPQAVMDAVDQVAEWVGEVEEIGSSDVSAWVAQVARYLQTQDGQGVAEGYWADAVKKAEADSEARKGKPFEKNPASHDKDGVYIGDKDLAGNPVSKRKEPGVAEAKADPLGAWIAHKNGTEARKFKTREGAKKYVASHEGFTVSSSEAFHDTYRKKKVQEVKKFRTNYGWAGGSKEPRSAHAKQVAAKRKEYNKGLGKFEPTDDMVGTARITKDVAETRIETIHGSAYTIDPNKYYVWAWDNAVVLYGEYTDENDAELNLSKIERRATKRLGPAVKGRFEVASGKMLLRQYGNEQGVAEEYNPEYDDEAGMADNNLSTLRRAVDGLDDLIDTGDNLPEWCQEKIAVAKSMLVTVWNYMESEDDVMAERVEGGGHLKNKDDLRAKRKAIQDILMDPTMDADTLKRAQQAKLDLENQAEKIGVAEGEKWIQKAVNSKTKGNLHKALHVPQDETIPKSRIAQAIHSADPHLRHMAQFAKNVAKEDAGGMGTGSVATSMGAGNGFANGGPGTITRRRK